MKQRTKCGQTTVEFALVISAFALLVFGVIEVGRAIYEKQALARAAETMVQTLAQADLRSTSSTSVISTTVQPAIALANRTADLGLSTTWPAQTTPIVGFYSVAAKMCVTSGGDPAQPCEYATNADSHVAITGLPTLTAPITITVAITVPYRSYIAYPLQLLGGQAKEVVAATTLCGQSLTGC